MLLPKREKIDVTKNVVFSSEPCTSCHDAPEDMHAIYVRLGDLRFVAYTIDPDFSFNVKRFEGEIKINYDSSWVILMDMLKLGMVQITFRFSKKDGRREALAAYTFKNILDKLRDC